MNVRSRLAWVRPFLMLVLVVTVPVVLYWFGYVSRTVSNAARQYNDAVVAVATSLEERLGTYNKIATAAEKRGEADVDKYLASLVAESEPSSENGARYLQITGDYRKLLLTVSPKDIGKKSISVKLEKLVPWDIVEAEFDGLLVISSSGHLLAQDRRLPQQARGLPIRIVRDNQPVDLAGLFELSANRVAGNDPNSPDNNKAADKSSTGSTSPRWRAPTDFTRFESITLAGQRYVSFLQPVRVYTKTVGVSGEAPDKSAAAPPPPTLDVLVAGLVSEDHLSRQVRTLSRQTMARVFAIVTFGVLLIPLLKLRFIGTHERMRYRDVWVMAIALLGMTSVVVLLVLDGPATGTVRQVLDVGLKELHQQIKARANAEADRAIQQLRELKDLRDVQLTLDAGASPAGDSRVTTAGACQDRKSDSAHRTSPKGKLLLGPMNGVSSVFPLDYPLVDSFFVADCAGQQVYKWDSRTLPTGLTSVDERSYFRDALALSHAGTDGSNPQRLHDTAREFVVSKTSGEEQMIFAMPIGKVGGEIHMGSDVPPDERRHVIALSTPMHSVKRPVVPSPYEYVLVGRDATVKFRKAKGPYLGERFFEKVGGGDVLKPAAGDDVDRAVGGRFPYRGHQYQMYASDVSGIGMTLVTYYDVETARQLAARSFAVAAGVALLAILSTMAGSLLAAFRWGRQAHDWLWPDTEDTARYVVGIAVCIAAVTLLVWIRGYLRPGSFAVFVAVIPAVVMILCGSPLWFRTRLKWTFGDAQTSPTLYTVAFCGFVLSMLLALIAVPTALAFDDALRLHVAAYERVAAEQWSRDLYREAERFDEAYAQSNTSETSVECTAPGRICASRMHYTSLHEFLVDPSDQARNDSADPGNETKAADDKKLHNMNLYRSCPPAAPGDPNADGAVAGPRDCREVLTSVASMPWSFTAFLARPLAQFSDDGQAFAMALSLPQSPKLVTSARVPLAAWAWTPAAPVWIVVGFAMLAIVIYTVAVHVLGLGWHNRRPPDVARDAAPMDGARWLVLRPTRASIRHLAGPTTHVVDFRLANAAASLEPPAAGRTLVVQHVEAALADDSRHDAVLALANGRFDGCLVLCSEIDPLYYVSQRIFEAVDADAAATAASGDDRRGRQKRVDAARARRTAWAEALQEFHRVQTATPRFPALGPNVSDHQRKLLWAECRFSEPLIEVAKRVARTPGLAKHTDNEIIGFVLDAARPYYRSIWDLCTEAERLLLIQLAEEGVVNPKRFDLLRQLHHRGLVLVEPRFQLMNRSFTEFVRNVESHDRVVELEHTPEALGWKRFSTPLYTLAAVVIAILLYTQQDLFAQMLGIATGAAGALNSLRNLGLLAGNASIATEKKSANA